MMDRRIEVVVSEAEAGMRLDRALAVLVPDLSRSRIQALLTEGRIVDAAGRAPGASTVARAGEIYRVDLPPTPRTIAPGAEAIPLDVVYEDDDLIVIDKPAGLVVHPAHGHGSGTLVNALVAHCGPGFATVGETERPGIVHRLDKDTSGLLVVAKSEHTRRGLKEQFAAHSVDRAYLAVVLGRPLTAAGTVRGRIGRDPRERKRMAALREGGREAVTHWRMLRPFGAGAALVECRLETGRTHQVRVHMTSIGHPLVGDPLYGRLSRARAEALGAGSAVVRGFPRQALHARSLGFVHPVTGQRLVFDRGPPADLADLIAKLGKLEIRRPRTMC